MIVKWTSKSGKNFEVCFLIHLNIFITIPNFPEVACKLLFRNNYCRMVIVGVETERFVVREVAVEEEMHMVFRIVYKPEG